MISVDMVDKYMVDMVDKNIISTVCIIVRTSDPGNLDAIASIRKSSAIIHMQKLLNEDIEKNRKIKRSINRACSREERLQSSVVYLCDNKNHK